MTGDKGLELQENDILIRRLATLQLCVGLRSELRRTALRDRFEGAVTVIRASPLPNPPPVTLPLTQIAKGT